ncbi:MAG TPA: hypothetical protein DCZ95_16575 [Verrucomicrobia bacterium]|nr:MAG: hypothetical protein A2X46_14700 [Lentisphaerae bacterium GWF2_57_35]HBA85698.1 hypothetical protein [Verrucomicrobiota bacterium]
MSYELRTWLLFGISLLAGAAQAQQPGVHSINNGRLTFTNINPSMKYAVEWSSSRSGTNFNSSYRSMEFVEPTGTSAMTISVPMSLRIAPTEALPDSVYSAEENAFNIEVGTNKKVSVEWAEATNGPWYTSWSLPSEVSVTGAFMNVSTPHYFRVSFINCPSNYHDCATWVDATAQPDLRTNRFNFMGYTKACLQIRVGQEVTFTGNFTIYQLVPDCQECGTLTNITSGIGDVSFHFTKPGYYGYHASGYGDSEGRGIAGNIRVLP